MTVGWVLMPGRGADGSAFDAIRTRRRGIAPRVVGRGEVLRRSRAAMEEACAAPGPGAVGLAGWSSGAHLALHAAIAVPGRHAAEAQT